MTEARETGRAGRKANEAMVDFWNTAAKLNAEHLGDGEWVPWRAIEIREEILPREKLDYEAVAQYERDFEQLPPIKVQRETFVLIGGRHRLKAATKFHDHIRIVEEDVADEDLWLEAFKDNTAHGVPLKQGERIKAGRRLLKERPDWSDALIAQTAGIDRVTVFRWRSDAVQREEEAAEREGRPVALQQVAPAARLGADGRVTTPSHGSPPPTPEPEPAPEPWMAMPERAAPAPAAPTQYAPPSTREPERKASPKPARSGVQASFLDTLGRCDDQLAEFAESLDGDQLGWMVGTRSADVDQLKRRLTRLRDGADALLERFDAADAAAQSGVDALRDEVSA